MKNQSAKKMKIPALASQGGPDAESLSIFGNRQILGRFSDVAMIAADWFWEMDDKLQFTYLSERFQDITGIDGSSIIGKSRAQAFAGYIDDSEKWEELGELMQRQESYEMVWTLVRSDGDVRVLRTRGKPIFDSDGRFLGYRGVGSDITESEDAMKALKLSETRFRDFAESAADWFFELDAELRIAYCSSETHLPSGRSASDFIGMSKNELCNKWLNKSESLCTYLEKLEAHEPFDMEIELQAEDREVCYLHTVGKPMLGDDGEFLGYRGCSRDVTEARLSAKKLEQSEERYRNIIDNVTDIIATVTPEGVYNFYNKSVERILGFSPEEIKRLSVGDLAIEEDRELIIEAHREALENPGRIVKATYRCRHKNGSIRVLESSRQLLSQSGGSNRELVIHARDITESHLLSQQLSYQATHDPLTGLVNRREFELRLGRVISESQNDDSEHALCYIDLDQFKVVNDTCGHDAGDELLRQISALLEEKVRKRDTIARLGGDEFGLLLERCSLAQANRVAETVRETIAGFRFIWANRNFRLGVSIGLIPIARQSGGLSEVMRLADAACYAAKDAGRNRIHVYHPDDHEVDARHAEMQRVVEINQAFDDGRFVLYQQPIKKLGGGDDAAGVFCEVLVRMLDFEGKIVLPGAFMPTAERYNLATQLDTYVVKASLDWLVSSPEVRCTINLSGMSIAKEEFLQFVITALETSQVDPRRVCFEITETAAIENFNKATIFINRLRERGCAFALDDFGSGLSSFAYLKTLPVDYLKIDGFFVRDIAEDRINYEMVKSINDIGHVMGKKTIAEFVENDQIMSALEEIGVDYAQGYGIAMPEPVRT